MATRDSLCIALDGSDRQWIMDTAGALAGSVGWLKIGLEAFVSHGPELIRDVAGLGPKVFLDLKLHDIPATVLRAAANCAECGAAMFTVHAGGGSRMLEAAVAGARAATTASPPRVVAVTVLTSLDLESLEELGIESRPDDLVLKWAGLAKRSGLSGVVASAREAASLRQCFGEDFFLVTPGIRPAGSASDDQRRVLTPSAALSAGSNLLVVGRPVTRSPDPVAAVHALLEEMASVE